MLVYILKSAACLAILFVFYRLFLEKESIHKFKRFYLLGALLFSLLVPALVFTEYVEVTPPTQVTYTATQPVQISEDVLNIPPALEADVLDIEPLLWGIYFLGLFFLGSKFIRNLFQIFRRIRRNPKYKLNRFTQVLLQEKITPHTFFSYIFLNKSKYEANQIPKEVLLHEETHAKQKHSWDVVFVEFLQVLFWVNPFIYLAKKAIKLNHEFLADQAVLQNNIDETTYKNTLLSYLSPDSEKKYQPLANAINYSSIKKRFTIMKRHTSKKAVLFRSLLLLPLLVAMLYGFSETKIETITGNPLPNNKVEKLEEKASQEMIAEYNKLAKRHNLFSDFDLQSRESEIRKVKHIYNLMTESQKNQADVFPKYPVKKSQEGASGKQVAEYNVLAKKYNLIDLEKRKIPSFDLEILEAVYKKMNTSQKAQAQPFPECLPENSQDGASRKLMSEYEVLAKKYNTMLSESKSIRIKKQDVERLQYIYGLMSDKQKVDAEPFPDFPEPPLPPRVKKIENSNTPPPPNPNLSEHAFAEKVIDETIANQDPYDHGNQLPAFLNGKIATLPVYPSRPRGIETKKEDMDSEWVVSSGANRDSRGIKDQLPIPPVAPTIAIHTNTDNYSKELKTAINKYLDKNKDYEEAIHMYSRKGTGNRQDLWNIYNEAMELYVTYYDLARQENNFLQPMPPKAPRVLKGEVSSDTPPPPAPPEPQSPLDHVIGMAKRGANFYYEGKKISSDRAIELLKENEDLNIQSSGRSSKKPTVKISKEPIYLDKSATPSSIETGNIEIKGDEGFYSKKDGITSYFNSKGEQVNKTGKVLHRKSENNPKFYFNNRQISSEQANRLLSSNNSIQMTSKAYKNGDYSILLTNLNSFSTQNINRNNNPNSVIDLTEMIEKDALFFYNDKPISTKKALWLTQNDRIERVNTIQPKKEKPMVYFWEKV